MPAWFAMLPVFHATLNAAVFVLIAAGLFAVRRGRVSLHKRCMGSAVVLSVVFLVSYLVYHSFAGTTRFATPGWPRRVYLFVLGSHTVLAAFVAVLAPFVVWFGLSGRIARHKPLARILAPIWLYVAATGVLVYLMLYHFFPNPAEGTMAR